MSVRRYQKSNGKIIQIINGNFKLIRIFKLILVCMNYLIKSMNNCRKATVFPIMWFYLLLIFSAFILLHAIHFITQMFVLKFSLLFIFTI